MNYLKIDTCNMNNGDGLRCVIWLSGCEHHCKNCFNPETWDKSNGDKFTEKQFDIICDTLKQNWCSGITLTGGDPLHPDSINEVTVLCKKIKNKFPNKTIWVYTGYTFDNNYLDPLMNIFNYIDILVDGEYVDELKSPFKHWVGSSNQRVIDIQQSLKQGEVIELE